MRLEGSYEGEGTNVGAGLPSIAAVPDAPARPAQPNDVTVDRRRRLRTSSESARDATAISVGGGDQTLSVAARGVYIGTAGNLVVRLVDATADTTFSNLSAGSYYPFAIAIVRQTGTTAAGVLLL
jgi:hypothetical protein